MKYAAFVALLLSVAVPPSPVLAQYVTVQCSQNIRAVGRPAAIEKNAEQSAIDSWDSEARRIHGASTAFTFRWGERLGRVQMTCSRNRGRVTCSTSGRSCVYVPTTTPNREVSASCTFDYVRDEDKLGCRFSYLGGNQTRIPQPYEQLECPRGYQLSGSRCTR